MAKDVAFGLAPHRFDFSHSLALQATPVYVAKIGAQMCGSRVVEDDAVVVGRVSAWPLCGFLVRAYAFGFVKIFRYNSCALSSIRHMYPVEISLHVCKKHCPVGAVWYAA